VTALITDLTVTVNFTEGMIKFAQHLETANHDDHSLLIAGIIKDSAYKIRKAIEEKTYCDSEAS
jgi:hypothetical protein